MVPKGWRIKQVGDLFDVQLGKMLNKAAKEKTPQYRYLGNSNVKWGFFDLSDLNTMHFSDRDVEKFTLKLDDIIMCEGGEVGRCAIWKGSTQAIFYQKALHRLRTKGQVVPHFFQHYMEKIAGTKLLDDYTTRTSIAHLTREKLISLPVLLPPLPEQKKIAQILSTWDKAITTTEQLLANSQQQKKALMQQLLTGKKRLLDENGVRFSGEWKSYMLEELEGMGWVELGRGNVISKKDIDTAPGDYPIYSSSVKNNGLMGKYGKYMFDEELISWSVDGGGNFFYRQKHKFSVTNVSGYMRIKTKKLNYQFVAAQLELHHSKLEFDYQSKAHPSVIRKVYTLAIPTAGEQQKITAILSTADQKIKALQQKIDSLKQEKKALMQQLLTGKRRVKVDGEVS